MAAPCELSVPSKKKTFIPLENNPEVMSHLARRLGVSPHLGFHDTYSIDDPDLLAYIPRPAYALIFTCPGHVYGKARHAEDEGMPTYTGSGPHEPVLWFKQTIGHACGLIALLHGLCNGGAKAYIQPGSDLDSLLTQAVPLAPMARAQLLYDSEALEAAHMDAARKGDTEAPDPEEEPGNHYICFVQQGGRLWELNGGMKGPVDRGALEEGEDALSERALGLGVRSFLEKAGEDDVKFSLVALTADLEP